MMIAMKPAPSPEFAFVYRADPKPIRLHVVSAPLAATPAPLQPEWDPSRNYCRVVCAAHDVADYECDDPEGLARRIVGVIENAFPLQDDVQREALLDSLSAWIIDHRLDAMIAAETH